MRWLILRHCPEHWRQCSNLSGLIQAIDAAGLERYPLFIAYPTAQGCFGVPAPWSGAALWQYSWAGSVRGIGVPVDRDRLVVPVKKHVPVVNTCAKILKDG